MIMKYKGSFFKDPCSASSFRDKVVLTAAEWLIQQNITVVQKGHHKLQVVNSITLLLKLALFNRDFNSLP